MAYIIEMPKLSDTMEEGAIASWLKKEGDFVEEGEPLAEIETDKATMDYASPEEGTLVKILIQAGQSCDLNKPIAILGGEGEKLDIEALLAAHGPAPIAVANIDKGAESKPPLPAVSSSPDQGHRFKSSPLARKIAQNRGVNLAQVVGSGPGGRVIQRDVMDAQPNSGSVAVASNLIAASRDGAQKDQMLPVSMMRKTIAKRLSFAKNDAPHFYLTRSCEMTRLISWRERLNKTSQTKISVNDVLILAVSKALRQHPEVNSSWQEDHILQHAAVHVAVAVALPEGLVTPVIPNSDQMGIGAIAAVSREKILRAKDGKLGPDEYQGGTFTISNLGMMGIEEFTAIINPPQAAILAIGATQQVPWVVEGQVVIQNRMKMTMSCDHRVIDGAVGSGFLQTLIENLEDPAMMLR